MFAKFNPCQPCCQGGGGPGGGPTEFGDIWVIDRTATSRFFKRFAADTGALLNTIEFYNDPPEGPVGNAYACCFKGNVIYYGYADNSINSSYSDTSYIHGYNFETGDYLGKLFHGGGRIHAITWDGEYFYIAHRVGTTQISWKMYTGGGRIASFLAGPLTYNLMPGLARVETDLVLTNSSSMQTFDLRQITPLAPPGPFDPPLQTDFIGYSPRGATVDGQTVHAPDVDLNEESEIYYVDRFTNVPAEGWIEKYDIDGNYIEDFTTLPTVALTKPWGISLARSGTAPNGVDIPDSGCDPIPDTLYISFPASQAGQALNNFTCPCIATGFGILSYEPTTQRWEGTARTIAKPGLEGGNCTRSMLLFLRYDSGWKLFVHFDDDCADDYEYSAISGSCDPFIQGFFTATSTEPPGFLTNCGCVPVPGHPKGIYIFISE